MRLPTKRWYTCNDQTRLDTHNLILSRHKARRRIPSRRSVRTRAQATLRQIQWDLHLDHTDQKGHRDLRVLQPRQPTRVQSSCHRITAVCRHTDTLACLATLTILQCLAGQVRIAARRLLEMIG